MSGPQDLKLHDLFIEMNDGTKWYPGRKDNKITVETIAHSLSGMARFNGHAKRLGGRVYTVAEHCVKVSYLVETLTGLMHDAHEVVTNDLSKPIKVFVGEGYDNLEAKTEAEFAKLFGLDYPHEPLIKKADKLMVLIEAFDLLTSKGKDWGYYQELRPEAMELYVERPELRPLCWSPETAMKEFLERYEKLAGGF